MSDDWYKLTFKSHRTSTRLYEMFGSQAAIFFTRASLENAYWTIVGLEKVDR